MHTYEFIASDWVVLYSTEATFSKLRPSGPHEQMSRWLVVGLSLQVRQDESVFVFIRGLAHAVGIEKRRVPMEKRRVPRQPLHWMLFGRNVICVL